MSSLICDTILKKKALENFARILPKRIRIKDSGFTVPELLICFQLIHRLSPEYDNLVHILYCLADDKSEERGAFLAEINIVFPTVENYKYGGVSD
ncbi:hypothetical protein CEXT_22401 [Caerostris extrusa]|uniref:Uncharacterized protein n=1 Tax=Caerostris extrusa TaxID=172846 RepID=A0AAV4VLU0_CAEEX|nr:hypothetical protein CEXT_22401 [Caerostris extrusa]